MVATSNTTRVGGPDPVATAIAVARFVWAEFRANAVILAPADLGAAALAAANLIHFPINAPILLTPTDNLDSRVARELERLAPRGENIPAQVFLVYGRRLVYRPGRRYWPRGVAGPGLGW